MRLQQNIDRVAAHRIASVEHLRQHEGKEIVCHFGENCELLTKGLEQYMKDYETWWENAETEVLGPA